MKGLILVGGYGTRLRPLTLSLPKPLVEFANRAMILHQIEALAKAGVTDIVLAVNYRPEVMVAALTEYGKEYGVNITFSVEEEPLGTAGPLKLAEKVLKKDNSPFFVLNSDVICDYPFEELAKFHQAHGAMGTIVATKVDEPSKYGVIVHDRDTPNLIDRFVEKPVEFVGNRINAGLYILNPEIIDLIPMKPTSIEKETFPILVERKQLYLFDLEGYWMDVGQPKDFLAGTALYLNSVAKNHPEKLAKGEFVHPEGKVLIDPSATIDPTALIGPNVTIGPNVKVGAGARVVGSVLLADSEVKDHALVKNTIVGWKSRIGKWARTEGCTVLGEDVEVKNEIYVNGAKVLPHKSISSNVEKESIIM